MFRILSIPSQMLKAELPSIPAVVHSRVQPHTRPGTLWLMRCTMPCVSSLLYSTGMSTLGDCGLTCFVFGFKHTTGTHLARQLGVFLSPNIARSVTSADLSEPVLLLYSFRSSYLVPVRNVEREGLTALRHTRSTRLGKQKGRRPESKPR